MEVKTAIENLRKLLDNFVGTKAQHLALDQSLYTLIANLKTDEETEQNGVASN